MPNTINIINPLQNPICLKMPKRDLPSAWMEHIPFGMYIMDILHPKIFVELGTFYGVSYCAFCQAVKELNLSTTCYAVDTWGGDAHTGAYDMDVLENLRQHHDPLYSTFSNLIQGSFDEAVSNFTDGTIDLLHIDGYHTYEAVKHDFDTWKPKLSRRGVVIFHDTNERSGDFGVWRLMEELKTQYPYFEFKHGHGLGIVAVGNEIPEKLLSLVNASEEDGNLIRNFFYEMGQRVSLSAALAEKNEVEYNLRNELQAKTLELERMQRMIIFRIFSMFRKVVKRIFPANSRGRQMIDSVTKKIRSMILSMPQLIKTIHNGITIWKKHGFLTLFRRIRFVATRTRSMHFYKKRVSSVDKESALNVLSAFKHHPLISIVMPTYNTPLQYLQAAVRSVQSQYYPNWELCICDDASTDTTIKEWLGSIKDDKIKVMFSKQNRGISAATNLAVQNTNGEYVTFLDHDDELTPDALFEMVQLLNKQPNLDVIYSDQDKIDHRGRRSEPFFKPDWSPEYMRSVMYIGHLVLMKRDLFDRLGGLNSMFDGVQDYELILKAGERTSQIGHIPKVLYHWRKIPGSVALGLNEKGDKVQRLQIQAVNAHLERIGYQAEAFPHSLFPHRTVIKPKPQFNHPKVSIIILSKNAHIHISRCLRSIFERTSYPNYEVLVVDNGTTDPLALRLLKESPVKVVPFNLPFNYSQANNLGAAAAQGEFIVFLNNDTEVLSSDWLEQMLFYFNDPDIAIVGPMLIYPDQTVQHAGIVLGLRSTADHIMRGFPFDSDGYAGSLSCPRNVSAVTGACLMMRKSDFLDTGGMVEYYGTHYQDLDLCLRFVSAGKRIVYVPYAMLVHYEGASRGRDYDHLDRALLLDTWGDVIAKGDPFYNPNFSLDSSDYAIR